MKHYAKLHTAEGEYEIVVREMNLISMATLKVSEPYWEGRIVFREASGRETPTRHSSSAWQSTDPSKCRVRAPLLKPLGHLRAYRARTGRRQEVEWMQEEDARVAARRAEREARKAGIAT